jgi:hypothetical protein
VVYDFESQQLPIKEFSEGHLKHDVNFICAHTFCTNCIDNGTWNKHLVSNCSICGPNRFNTWSHIDYHDTPVDKHVVTDNPLEEFVSFLLKDLSPKYPSYCFAHYGGRYDITFLFGEFVKACIPPDMIRQGNRLFEMTIRKTRSTPLTIFGDSFNLIPSKLDDLVKQFDLPIQPKPYFVYV